jgi:hypothetical protein
MLLVPFPPLTPTPGSLFSQGKACILENQLRYMAQPTYYGRLFTELHRIRFSNSTEMASAADKDIPKELETFSQNSHTSSV